MNYSTASAKVPTHGGPTTLTENQAIVIPKSSAKHHRRGTFVVVLVKHGRIMISWLIRGSDSQFPTVWATGQGVVERIEEE